MAEQPYRSPFHVTEGHQCLKCLRYLVAGDWIRVDYGVYEARCACGQLQLLWEYEDGKALSDVRF